MVLFCDTENMKNHIVYRFPKSFQNFNKIKFFTLVPPQIMPFAFGDEASNTGDSIGIQCMANKGDLPIDIRWILNTSPIVSGENDITIIKLNPRTSSLNINYLDGVHRGSYKCMASNSAGTSEYSAQLFVNGLFLDLVTY